MKAVLTVGLVLLPSVFSQCRKGWENYKNQTCYFFSSRNAANWATSEYDCQMLGGFLAEPETKPKIDYIEGHLRTLHYGDPKKNSTVYFLGGTDMELDGQFVWIKTRHPFTYTDWYPGEPNNYRRPEDCLGLLGTFDFHWGDVPCDASMNFICEMSDFNYRELLVTVRRQIDHEECFIGYVFYNNNRKKMYFLQKEDLDKISLSVSMTSQPTVSESTPW